LASSELSKRKCCKESQEEGPGLGKTRYQYPGTVTGADVRKIQEEKIMKGELQELSTGGEEVISGIKPAVYN